MGDWTPIRIRSLRERLGQTQAEFADTLGYGAPKRISELERGVRDPSGPAKKLLDYLDAHGLLRGTADDEA